MSRDPELPAGDLKRIGARTLEPLMDVVGLIQWPAFVTSVSAAWLVASTKKPQRNAGFWVSLLSNVLWVVWGLHTDAMALVALQLCLAALNVRGLRKTERDANKKSDQRS